MAIIESSVEGPITAVSLDMTATPPVLTISCMGTTVMFTDGTTANGRIKRIRTPTTTLSIQQFMDNTPFPGRAEAGFIGGTLIAEGTVDTNMVPIVLNANFIDVEPSESVLLGAVTQNDAGSPRQISINGAPISMLTDARLCSNPDNPGQPIYVNQYGFAINPASIQLGSSEAVPTSAEGYYAAGNFHAFLFEYGGSGDLAVVPPTTPQLSIERADYREDGSLVHYDVRGFATRFHLPNGAPNQSIDIYRLDFNPATGLHERMRIDSADVETRETGYERWRLSHTGNRPGGFRSGPPRFLMAVNVNENFSEQTEPDIRED
ncbi:hypothetical protein [Blastopirellula marina]|nr:hypothetical protein [Blastopirellula marina]